jgi:hypothetical protein
MKKQRLTETQIVSILKQYDGGRDSMELCREFGISKATLYNWRKKYAGMDASHLINHQIFIIASILGVLWLLFSNYLLKRVKKVTPKNSKIDKEELNNSTDVAN